MSGAMSTPVNTLPKADNPPPPPADPNVTDVLAEMEREVAAATQRSAPSHPHQPQTPPSYGYPQTQQMPMMLPPYVKEPSASFINRSKAQTAVIATIIAMLLLIPNVSFLYERVQRLAPFKSYELFIRGALLAVVLYVAMMKLNL